MVVGEGKGERSHCGALGREKSQRGTVSRASWSQSYERSASSPKGGIRQSPVPPLSPTLTFYRSSNRTTEVEEIEKE